VQASFLTHVHGAVDDHEEVADVAQDQNPYRKLPISGE